MKISVKGRYGLAAMISLGLNQPNKLSSTIISEKLGLSKIYLEQVLTLLKKANLIVSEKGANGGYTLAKPLNAISSYDILYAIETNLFVITESTSSNPHIEKTLNNLIYNKVDAKLEAFLSNITLEILVNEVKKANEINMYYI
mgnify:CR=1 FL=1